MNDLFELKFDANLAQELLKQQTKITPNSLLTDPELTQEQGIEKIIQEHQQKYPQDIKASVLSIKKSIETNEIAHKRIQDKINQLQETINKQAAKKLTLTQQAVPLYKQLQSMFPKRSHETLSEHFDNPYYLLKNLYNTVGFWKKTFQKSALRKQFYDLYNKITEITGTDLTPGQIIESIDSKIKNTQDTISIHEKEIQQLQHNAPSYDKIQERFNEYNLVMHTKIAEFMYTYASRDQLRKNIPPILNTENLSEPVCFSRIISGVTESQLEKLLTHAGLPVGYAPSDYIVRRTKNIGGQDCVELVTPFYSPDVANQNITALLQYLAAHNAGFEGVVVPATYRQINPKASQTVSDPTYLIRKKMEKAISVDVFKKEHTGNPNLIYRGQTFMTGDKYSSYSTPTWRPGRTGIVYATNNPQYATTYATTGSMGQIAGQTMDPKYFRTFNGHTVGMVTVYQKSPDNIFVEDLSLEKIQSNSYEGPGNLQNNTTNFHLSETIVCPEKNPVVKRYMIIGDKMMLVDENDADWHKILDYFAPDLNITHMFGPSDNAFVAPNQKTHGKQFIDRINEIEYQIKKNGAVKTYDIPKDIMAKLNPAHNKSAHFQSGAKAINEKQPPNIIENYNDLTI